MLYDIIVIGGGHAGIEASLIASKLGSKTLMITMNKKKIGYMACNPSIGGIGKGQLVKEIDALGGYIGLVTNKSMIHFKMLNTSKGLAMWSPRAQVDKKLFSTLWKKKLFNIKNLTIIEDNVINLLINKQNTVIGVKCKNDIFKSKCTILTGGTFLNSKIFIGNKKKNEGRLGETNNNSISKQLKKYGFIIKRLKTGTSPRVDYRSLDITKFKIQKSDLPYKGFSFIQENNIKLPKFNCYITKTNSIVNKIILDNLNKSPLFNGNITSKGPRYCTSIESKILKFKNKNHQIFIEKEGLNTYSTYINGFSISLPLEIQYKALKEIDGFNNVIILKPGYTVEYDIFDPKQLNYNLETKIIKNLYFAGQINGTTGYEEAAAQGIIAGINAHLYSISSNYYPIILNRKNSYIGVLINDLVYKGIKEPYRMLISRSENRIKLRSDNADERLTNYLYNKKLISEKRYKKLFIKKKIINYIINKIKKQKISRKKFIKENKIYNYNNYKYNDIKSIFSFLSIPNTSVKNFLNIKYFSNKLINLIDMHIIREIDIIIKYNYYFKKEEKENNYLNKMYNFNIPKYINYYDINSISKETLDRLNEYRPKKIKEIFKISGIRPTDIMIIFIYIKKIINYNNFKI